MIVEFKGGIFFPDGQVWKGELTIHQDELDDNHLDLTNEDEDTTKDDFLDGAQEYAAGLTDGRNEVLDILRRRSLYELAADIFKELLADDPEA